MKIIGLLEFQELEGKLFVTDMLLFQLLFINLISHFLGKYPKLQCSFFFSYW